MILPLEEEEDEIIPSSTASVVTLNQRRPHVKFIFDDVVESQPPIKPRKQPSFLVEKTIQDVAIEPTAFIRTNSMFIIDESATRKNTPLRKCTVQPSRIIEKTVDVIEPTIKVVRKGHQLVQSKNHIEFHYSDVILSLLTTFDDDDHPHTRSVNLFNPGGEHNTWVIVDRLSFHLFISIPRELSITRLHTFMIRSYWSSKYRDMQGYYDEEIDNDNLSTEVKDFLQEMDDANRELIEKHLKRRPLRRRIHHQRNVVDEEEEEEDSETNCLIHSDVDFITNIEELGYRSSVYYKITFDNHLILRYFMERFANPIEMKLNEEDDDDDKVTINIKVMNFFRANDILPIRINYDTEVTISSDEYIENQLTFFKEDLRKEKKRMDGVTLKKGNELNYKLCFNAHDDAGFEELDDGILHPSYHLKYPHHHYQHKFQHRLVYNTADRLNDVDTLQKSKHTPSIAYQSLYIDVFEWSKKNQLLLVTDSSKRVIPVVKGGGGGKRQLEEGEGGGDDANNKKKKVKSIHYQKEEIYVPKRIDYNNTKKTKQVSIVGFLTK